MRYLVVASIVDPVARGVQERWGTPPSTEWHVDGVPIRWLSPGVGLLRRTPHHVFDERLDERLPGSLAGSQVPLVFPSIHRSSTGTACFTVHPIGNLGGNAPLGGNPRQLVPTSPHLMGDALRQLAEEGAGIGLPATLEATHHGPFVECPAFFVELGGSTDSEGRDPHAISRLARVLANLSEDPEGIPALGVGGGHYVPHFTELALRRKWAFGHLIPRHALEGLDPPTARQAWQKTPAARGIVFASARDSAHPAFRELGPRLADSHAPRRERSGVDSTVPASGSSSRAFGT